MYKPIEKEEQGAPKIQKIDINQTKKRNHYTKKKPFLEPFRQTLTQDKTESGNKF